MSRVTLRKIQLVGGATLTVSLPKEWVRRLGLGAGDLVEVSLEPDGSLKIFPHERVERKSDCVIDISEGASKGTVIRELMSKYLIGYNTIIIKFPYRSSEYRKDLRKIISDKLIGVEVIDESSDRLTIQVLVNVKELPVNASLQRMAHVASGMLKDGLTGLLTNDRQVLEDVLDRDNVVDKLYLYTLRQINAVIRGYLKIQDIGLGGIGETLEYGIVAKSIERVADHAQRIAFNVIKIIDYGNSIDSDVVDALRDYDNVVNDIFMSSVNSFIRRNRKKAHELLDNTPSLISQIENKVSKVASKVQRDVALYFHLRMIMDSMRRVTDYSMDISEATIDLS